MYSFAGWSSNAEKSDDDDKNIDHYRGIIKGEIRGIVLLRAFII